MTTPTDWYSYPTGKIAKGAYCDSCGRYNARHVTCTALAVNQQGQVMLTKRKRDPQAGWWCMPGGYIEWDETIAECAVRELAEEVGINVTADKAALLDVFSSPSRDLDGRQNVDCCLIVPVSDVELVLNEEEVAEAKWFSVDELPEEIAFDHRQMIIRWMAQAD